MPNHESWMGHNQGEPTVSPFPRCTACDDVIGVYEPLINVFGGAVPYPKQSTPGVAGYRAAVVHDFGAPLSVEQLRWRAVR